MQPADAADDVVAGINAEFGSQSRSSHRPVWGRGDVVEWVVNNGCVNLTHETEGRRKVPAGQVIN